METPIKVQKTRKVEIPQNGTVQCIEGKLVVLGSTEQPLDECNDEQDLSIWRSSIKPIIISETEMIAKDDITYGGLGDEFEIGIYKDKYPCKAGKFHTWKVLVLPEHFTFNQLQDIIDGKMKDGDKILVQCEDEMFDGLHPNSGEEGTWHTYEYHVKQLLTLHPTEETWREMWKKFLGSDKSKTDIGFYLFLQENYHLPKHK